MVDSWLILTVAAAAFVLDAVAGNADVTGTLVETLGVVADFTERVVDVVTLSTATECNKVDET